MRLVKCILLDSSALSPLIHCLHRVLHCDRVVRSRQASHESRPHHVHDAVDAVRGELSMKYSFCPMGSLLPKETSEPVLLPNEPFSQLFLVHWQYAGSACSVLKQLYAANEVNCVFFLSRSSPTRVSAFASIAAAFARLFVSSTSSSSLF